MIQSFSGGFDLVQVDVIEHPASSAVLPTELYKQLRESYSKDIPLVLKLEDSYFTAFAQSSVPYRTLALPEVREFAPEVGGTENLWVIDEDHAQKMYDHYVRGR